jgi:hypothetical protein
VFAGLLTAVSLSRVWFYYDDFWNLAEARLNGWGWTQLTHSVLGHFYPGYNLSFWVVHSAGPAGYPLGVALTAGGITVIGLLVADVARLLDASTKAAALATGATLIFGAWPAVTLWLSAATNSVPAALFMLAALDAHLRWLRLRPSDTSTELTGAAAGHADHHPSTPRRVLWAALAGLAFGCGLAFYETAIFVLGVFVGVTVLAFTSGGIGHRWRQFLRTWPLWLAYLPPIAVLAIAFNVGPYGEEFSADTVTHPEVGELARVAAKATVNGLGTSLIGLHPGRFDLFATQGASNVAAGAVLLLGLVWLWRRVGPMALFAAAVVLVPFALRMALAAWGRLQMLGWDIAHDVRYFADYAWVVPVVVLAALAGAPARARVRPRPASALGVGSGPHGEVIPSNFSWRRLLAPGIALVLVFATWRANVVVDTSPQKITRAYYNQFAQSYAEVTANGSISLLDTLVPAEVLGPQFGGFTHLSHTLTASFDDLPFNDPYAPMYAPDFDGKLQPVELLPISQLQPKLAFTSEAPVTTSTTADGAECWLAGDVTARVWVPLNTPVDPGFGVVTLDVGAQTTAEDVPVLAAGLLEIGYIGSAISHDWSRDRVVISSHYFAATQLGFDVAANQQLCLVGGVVQRLAPPVAG